MNLQELKQILDNGLPEEVAKSEVINWLSREDDIVMILMGAIQRERDSKRELMQRINLLLSRAHVCLSNPNFKDTTPYVIADIEAFYLGNNAGLKHSFNQVQ